MTEQTKRAGDVTIGEILIHPDYSERCLVTGISVGTANSTGIREIDFNIWNLDRPADGADFPILSNDDTVRVWALPPTTRRVVDNEQLQSDINFTRGQLEADIARHGTTASYMIRSGLLLDILTALDNSVPSDPRAFADGTPVTLRRPATPFTPTTIRASFDTANGVRYVVEIDAAPGCYAVVPAMSITKRVA